MGASHRSTAPEPAAAATAPASPAAPPPGSAGLTAWEREATFHVEDLACRGCARHAERALRHVEGVRAARVGFVGELAQVVYDVRRTTEREIVEAMRRAGFGVAEALGAPPSERVGIDRTRVTLALVLFANLVALGIAGAADPAYRGPWWARLALAVAILALGARPLAHRAVALLRRGVLGRDALAGAAAIGALGVGVVELVYGAPGAASPPGWLSALGFRPEPFGAAAHALEAAGGIVVFAMVGRAVAAAVQRRAQAPLVLAARDRAAQARKVDDAERVEWVAREALALGDRVRLIQSETAPADLRLEADARVWDRGPAGDPYLVDRHAGEVMSSGSALASAEVTGRVARPYRAAHAAAMDAETYRSLARIERELGGGAEGGLGEIAARGLCIATLTFAVFALLAHAALRGGPAHVGGWVAAIAVLVAASPAAFAVAAPLARSIAVLRARAAGVLVKDVAALEALGRADVACFDKTATVTSGDVRVTGITWTGSGPDRRILEDVLALERLSTHRAGRAIAAYLAGRGVGASPIAKGAPVTLTEDGVAGRVREALVEVGSARRFGSPSAPEAPAGATLAWFGKNGQPLGYLELSDPLRPAAQPALRALWLRGIACRLVSGDRREATLAAAHRLGVPGAGGLSRSEKALHVRDLQHGGSRVLYVGDGPDVGAGASHADVAVAIAPLASPAAVAAPIVMSEARLDHLPWLVDLSRSLAATLRQNVGIAIAFNAVVIPLATLGLIDPLRAAGLALAEMLIVLANAARLLRARPPEAQDPPRAPAHPGDPSSRAPAGRPVLVSAAP